MNRIGAAGGAICTPVVERAGGLRPWLAVAVQKGKLHGVATGQEAAHHSLRRDSSVVDLHAVVP